MATHELDDMFKVLAAQPRRVILRELIDDEVVEIEELLEALVANNPEWKSDDPDVLLTALYHQHLPFLAEAGLVQYDDYSETVRYTGNQVVEAHLEIVEDHG